jgi:hypothetical protein
MAAAEKFIRRALWDHDLVRQVNAAPDSAAVAQLLAELDLSFNCEEFEESCRHLLTQCQTYEQAAPIEEIKLWWHCLGQALNQSEPPN